MREDEMRVVRRERGQRVILARGNMVVMRANVPPRTQWCFVRRWNGTPRHPVPIPTDTSPSAETDRRQI